MSSGSIRRDISVSSEGRSRFYINYKLNINEMFVKTFSGAAIKNGVYTKLQHITYL